MIVLADGHSLAEVADEVAADGVEIDQSLSSASAFEQATPTMRSIATALLPFVRVWGLGGAHRDRPGTRRGCRMRREATTPPSGRWAPPGRSDGLG